jgi:hypothetical protein
MEFLLPSMTLFVAVTLGLVVNYVKVNAKLLYAFTFILTIFSTISVGFAYGKRFVQSTENRVQQSLVNLKNSSRFLDSLGISKTEKISLINGYGGNMALMRTGRVGYAAEGANVNDYKNLMDHPDSKYVLSQDQFFMYDVVNVYPEILSQLQLVASNETLSLYKKKDSSGRISGKILSDYVDCHNKTDVILINQDFETLKSATAFGEWSIHGQELSDSGYKSNTCLRITRDQEFPCTYQFLLKDLGKKPKGLVITGMFFSPMELRKVCFVTSYHKAPKYEGQYFFEQFKISKKIKEEAVNRWSRVSCKISLPDNASEDDMIKVYIWNPNKGEFVMDDFSFIFY